MTREPKQRERESQASEHRELLEIYQLHADLADRVSQRREGANRLFVSLLTGLMVFGAVFLRFGTGQLEADAVMACFGILGVLLAVAWFFVIRSYRQLNTGKFQALQELEGEARLPVLPARMGAARRRLGSEQVLETHGGGDAAAVRLRTALPRNSPVHNPPVISRRRPPKMSANFETDLLRPVAVAPREGFRIWLRYADGVEGEVDLSHLAGKGVFRRLARPDLLRTGPPRRRIGHRLER